MDPLHWSRWLGRPEQQEGDLFKQLWAEEAEEVRLKQYSFMDEGPTVLVLLDLNEHLPLEQASSAAPWPVPTRFSYRGELLTAVQGEMRGEVPRDPVALALREAVALRIEAGALVSRDHPRRYGAQTPRQGCQT